MNFVRFLAISAALLGLWPTSGLQFIADVQGIVVDSGNGLPLEGAVVYLVPKPSQAFKPASTDSEGRFVLTSAVPGRYRVAAFKNGFVWSRPDRIASPREPGLDVDLTRARKIENIVLAMEKESVVSGRLLETNGRGLFGASVRLLRYRYDEAGRRKLVDVPYLTEVGNETFRANGFARTDDRGEYRFPGVQPGEYYIRFWAGPEYTGLFYPGTADETLAKTISVKSGQELRLGSLVLTRRTTAQARFRLTGVVGVPRFQTATLFPSGESSGAMSRPNDSTVTVPQMMIPVVPSGSHTVLLTWTSTDAFFFNRFDLDVGSSDIEKEIAMRPGIRLRARIMLEDGSGLPPGLRCRLVSDNDQPTLPADPHSVCTHEQFIPDHYQLEMEGMPADAYVVSAKAGEKDVVTEGLDLFADTALQIVVRMDGGVIGGSVRNSEGRISGAIVALIPEAPLRSAGVLYRSVISDFNGDFELRGIRPGAYRLFAWADMEGAAYRNTEFMKDHEGQGIRVRVENQVRQTIDVMAF